MGVLRAVLVLLVLACVASVGVWIAHGDGAVSPALEAPAREAPAPAAEPDAAPDAGPAALRTAPDEVIHLRVLNGTPTPGLAGAVSLRLDRAGCVADRVDNAPHDRYARTLLINRRLDDARAEALAARLGGPRLLREFDARAAEDAVLVLGADHGDLAEILHVP